MRGGEPVFFQADFREGKHSNTSVFPPGVIPVKFVECNGAHEKDGFSVAIDENSEN